MLNSYEQFFEHFPRHEFIDFGLDNIISIEKSKAQFEWSNLKDRIGNKDKELYVRNSGRNATGNKYLIALYKELFEIEINFDRTNNQKPTSLLENLSGLKKNKTIQNYQVSHVFGRTKNVYCFTAPWNIVFVPKIVDPLTGHEAKGDFAIEFRNKFQAKIFNKYKDQIMEFNTRMHNLEHELVEWISLKVPEKLRNSIKKDFEEINISS